MIFEGKGDYSAFIDLLNDCVEMWNIRVVAYRLMGTHYHILVQTPDANLSRGIRHIDGVYTHVSEITQRVKHEASLRKWSISDDVLGMITKDVLEGR